MKYQSLFFFMKICMNCQSLCFWGKQEKYFRILFTENFTQHVSINKIQNLYFVVEFLYLFVSDDLLRHMVKHTGEKRFTCSVCSKRFTRAHYLNEHMNTHTGKTPYKCSQCDAAFSLATKLYCHKRKHRRELAQKLVRETQSEGVIIQSIPQDNQSVSHIEIQNVEQTGSPKHINNTITLLHDPENQSDFVESVRQNPILIQQTENGLKIIDQSDSGIPTGTALLEKQRNVSVSHVNEGLWSGEEQCVELVIGQDISEEDLKNLITSRVISLNP